MELASVTLARAIALIETGRLNPRGELPREKFVSLVCERFSFMEFPSKLEDFDRGKGISFKAGYFDGQSIEELSIYNDGIKIDLRSSTENGQKIITDTLEWLKAKVGITYTNGMIPRWGYLSQLVVRSEIDFDKIHSAFSRAARAISEKVTERAGENFNYRTNAISFDFPKINGERTIANFTIERRIQTPDLEKLYYSQSPTQTSDHMKILEEFERDLIE